MEKQRRGDWVGNAKELSSNDGNKRINFHN